VTNATPLTEILFVYFGEIVHMHPHFKYVALRVLETSFTRFGDMFEGVQNFKRSRDVGHPT